MMQNGMNVNQRDIVFIPFPFTNLSGNKKRPVLILSGMNYNSKNNDLICCALTCREKHFCKGIIIDGDDLDSGNLDYKSVVVPCKVFTFNRGMIIKKLGRLNIQNSKKVVEFLNLNIEIED